MIKQGGPKVKLVTFEQGEALKVNIKTNRGILNLEKAAQVAKLENPGSIDTILNQGQAAVNTINQIIEAVEETNNAELYCKRVI